MRLVNSSRVLIGSICLSWLLGVVAAVQAAADSDAAAGALRGRVTVIDREISVPVRRAIVTLTSSTGEIQNAPTGIDGGYRFDGIRPGRYGLNVVKPGFYIAGNAAIGLAASAAVVEVNEASTAIRDVTVERGGAIEGFVFYGSGEAAKDVVVRVHLASDAKGRLTDASQPARSDDRGFYRLHTLPPGEYIVEADVLSRRAAEAFRGITSGSPTYYPGVTDVQGATRITVPARSVAQGISFTLTERPTPTTSSREAAVTATQLSPEGTSRIAGQIAGPDRGPIAGAVVEILPWRSSSDMGRGRVTTNREGRWEFAVVPGAYQVRVSAAGFVPRTFGWAREQPKGRPVELEADQTFTEANVVLPRNGAVEGRIFDEFGDPVPGVSVELAAVDFVAGAARLVPGARSRPTDDRGVYRIFDVPPDDYYALALSGPFARDAESDVIGFAPTLYPGTRSGTEAKPVHVDSGTDTSEINFAAVSVLTSEVRGKVVRQDGAPVSDASVFLMPVSDGDVRIMRTRALTRTNADGLFVYRNVPVGSYAIQAQVSSLAPGGPDNTNKIPVFGYSTLQVSTDSRTALRVEARPPATLSGRVVFEGGGAPSASDVQITTVPVDFISAPFEMRVQRPRWTEGNTFTLDGIVGRQVMRAALPGDSWVLNRILLEGKDVTDTPIDFGRGDIKDVEIVFRSIGATVTGRVMDGNDLSADYWVVLFADDQSKWVWPSRFVMLGRPNQKGEYRITGVLPGDYRAVALSHVPDGRWRSQDFLKTLLGRSTAIRLTAGQALTVELKLTHTAG